MKHMRNQQSGFTLIELVMVIVILGILAATALPRFVNLSGDANNSVAAGYAGALNSANGINTAGCAAVNNVHTVNKCVAVTRCSEVGALLAPSLAITAQAAGPYADKGVFVTADTAVAVGATTTCNGVYGNGAAGVAFTYTAQGV